MAVAGKQNGQIRVGTKVPTLTAGFNVDPHLARRSADSRVLTWFERRLPAIAVAAPYI